MGLKHVVPPTTKRLEVKRDGSSITRSIPKPVVIVNTREQDPFSFTAHSNWIEGTVSKALDAADYSVVGMENILRMERKSLPDLVMTLSQNRSRFFRMCEKLEQFKHRAILVEASYEDVKSNYAALGHEYTSAFPNAISGSLDALEAKFGIQVIYTSRHKPLAEEKAASWLSKHFTYHHLEQTGQGRVLIPGDL